MFCILDTFFGKNTNITVRGWDGPARRETWTLVVLKGVTEEKYRKQLANLFCCNWHSIIFKRVRGHILVHRDNIRIFLYCTHKLLQI